ncbi:MAG: hypothetical protein R6T98_06095 [Desulfatiglandales bacterium]
MYKVYYSNSNCIQQMVLWFVFIMLFLLSRPAVGFAETSPMGLVKSASVTIEGKTSNAIIVGERHFIVTESTAILNKEGEKIRLGDIPVPCKANIEYLLRMDRDPETMSITIKQALPGSSPAWSSQDHK